MTWAETKEIETLQKTHGESENGNYKIIDTIPIPHPYMVTSKHLEYNRDEMYLGIEQIERMEKEHGPLCGQRINAHRDQCTLKYGDHKSGLLIQCKLPMTSPEDKTKFNDELYKYMLKIKENLDTKKFDGFGFVDMEGKGAK